MCVINGKGYFEVVSVRNPEDLVFQLSINDSVSLMIYLQLPLNRTTKRPKMVVKKVTQELAALHVLLSLSAPSLFFCRPALRISAQMTDEIQPLTCAQTQTPPYIPMLRRTHEWPRRPSALQTWRMTTRAPAASAEKQMDRRIVSGTR